MRGRLKTRRGIVILVVLSLLVLFVVLAVTFAVVAGMYSRTAEAQSRQEQLSDDPEKQLDSAMYQLVRGVPLSMSGSALRGHDIERDKYGGDGFSGYLTSAVADISYLNATGNQFMEVKIDGTKSLLSTDSTTYTLSQVAGCYCGCEFTMTSGTARDITTRILGYGPPDQTNNTPATLRIVAMQKTDNVSVSAADLVGQRFVVNGRPFNGFGIGYNASTGKLDKMDLTLPSFPVALLPNYSLVKPASDGDVDEGHDAVDVHSMFMGLVLPGATNSNQIIPSLHRQALANYWWKQVGSNAALPDLAALANVLPRIVLRPLPMTSQHPNFSGGNSGTGFNTTCDLANPGKFADTDPKHPVNVLMNALVNGPWDVDNDGDGVPDSIWVDLGFPVVTATDGRRYKPLFAILCTDLDGRFNVNAHGNPTELKAAALLPSPVTVAGGGNSSGLPVGFGYGPPEIRLGSFFGSELTDLFYGTAASYQNGRYVGQPGGTGYDLLAHLRFFDQPQNYFTGGAAGRRAYSSPPDIQGEIRFGLDLMGQPVFEQSKAADVRADSAYELNLSVFKTGGTSLGYPYTAAELERLLRWNDVDRSLLPSRLSRFSVFNTAANRQLVTTDSFDLPVPNMVITDEFRKIITELNKIPTVPTVPRSILDLLAIRLLYGGVTPANLNAELVKMLSPDLIMGLRMDINRPFGNGQDDNGNGVIDEPGEESLEKVFTDMGAGRPEYNNVSMNQANGMDVNGDGTVDNKDALLARQLYARHLYVLMLTLMDHGGPPNKSPDPLVAQAAAQWAINVVDFRDADSIMTPFEYDKNPFDGWSVDGDLMTNEGPSRGVVWGSERPELIIGETVAWHDRRTEDLKGDSSGHKTTDPTNPDDDFDQRLRPRGSFFVELNNPWSGTDTQMTPPQEFYGNAAGVRLDRKTPGGNPVWRLVVVSKYDDANFPNTNIDDVPTVPRERGVYFVQPNIAKSEGARFWTSQTVAPIPPGGYAVVGSAGTKLGAEFCSFLGRPKVPPVDESGDNLEYDNTPRIALIPNANPGVKVYAATAGGVTMNSAAAIGIPVDKSDIVGDVLPMGLSVSEPLAGYPSYPNNSGPNSEMWDPALVADSNYKVSEGEYSAGGGVVLPLDTPLDSNSKYQECSHVNGTTPNFCKVYLQRLANPLLNWHAAYNPYRTIDAAPVDLTTFNGLDDFGSTNEPGVVGNTNLFNSLQRGDGGAAYNNPNLQGRNLWMQQFNNARNTTPADQATYYFPYELYHTLGKVNVRFQGAGGPAFPWLAWLNRPFVSQYELMQVPRCGTFDLLTPPPHVMSQPQPAPPLPPLGGFGMPGTSTVSPYDYDPTQPRGQFNHLWNFFETTPAGATHAFRLFEFTCVPSRFVGTETWLNPTKFASGVGTDFLHAPFNRISNYRDPGRVNLNTIMDQRIYDAIMNGFNAPTWDQFVTTRRGWGAVSGTILPTPDPSYPDYFSGAFRGLGTNRLPGMERDDPETTLLRSAAPPGTPPNVPLFQGSSTAVYNDVERNAYFRYQNLHRLPNLVTERSNVFAVWVTVGYFNVDGSDRLEDEVGSDLGEIKRHRAFYIIDRSIPVAFEPGENHNVDRCILLRRIIE